MVESKGQKNHFILNIMITELFNYVLVKIVYTGLVVKQKSLQILNLEGFALFDLHNVGMTGFEPAAPTTLK